MNQTEYQKWMERAFLYVEASLSMELATPSRVCMSEEYLRSSFIRGLSHSDPTKASRVNIEWDAPWTDAKCWKDRKSKPGQGRKIQHDVRISQGSPKEHGAACEAKWLKQAKSEEVIRDIWKLMLSRSTLAHGRALRCYLLLGGEGESFKNTMTTLRKNGVVLQWRKGSSDTFIDLEKLLKRKLGLVALRKLLEWKQEEHFRTPPDCLAKVRCVRRASWYRTLDGIKWRMGLWELSAWGANAQKVDWRKYKSLLIE